MAGKNTHSYFLRKKGSTRNFPSPSSTGRPLPLKVYGTLARTSYGNDRDTTHHDFLCKQLASVLLPDMSSTPLVPRSMSTRFDGVNTEERPTCVESNPPCILKTPRASHVLGMDQSTGNVIESLY